MLTPVTPRLMRERWPFDVDFYDRSSKKTDFRDIIERFNNNFNNIPLNIREESNQFIYEFYLTGFKKDEIELNLNNHQLTVQANKSQSSNNGYVYQESTLNKSRTVELPVELPTNVNTETINATYEDGILYVTINKRKTTNSNSFNIPIK